ncbi:fibrinogen-like YCDxxxxGGGW domain-containing protein [Jatrophihabitans sp.]|uniref:fibrinogen-like YCDxxxxGGGW domain-containing protein n=1 Tax=Jatrophihabitans sp. TaxID=1932789 RepID=UPI002C8E5A25|nr:fibrinogen-like YCDxxxxGGGW domain-containing protein [Jatrophihabitans sp.]
MLSSGNAQGQTPIGARWRRGRALLAVAVLAGGLLAGGLTAPAVFAAPAVAAATPPGQVLDGSQPALAAPSCWAIKQQNPASPDGIYWLQTAQLVAPEQFYCDQTTNGGGWVLVGRGREGWNWAYGGQGSVASLRTTPTGTAAFAPATLPAATISGLLGGGRVDALTDGIRVRRATNTNGTTYQEMRIKASNRSDWTWAIGGGVLFSSISVDGTSYGSGNTQSWSRSGDQNFLRLTTNEQANHNYKMGWAFGNKISGQNNATSYLWQYTTEKSALPFTQVFLRPMLTSGGFSPIPAAGLPASTVRPLVSSTTSPNTPWGVTGIAGAVSELNMEVETFAQIGNVMYVGGGFQNVQKGANPAPADKIAQSWLAGFDVNTGEWLSSFRPSLNAMVWDLQATPDGKLVVGGEFTMVNGVADNGIVELDPITGATVPGWSASVDFVTTELNTPAQVKAIDYQDGWLYIGGRFNRVTGGTPVKGPVTVGRAARLRVSDGQPDGAWKPNFDGSVIELDASAQGDRVYFSGYFNNLNGAASPMFGVVSTASGAATVPSSWQPSLGSGTNSYQQAVKEDGNAVWLGGSQHILSKYDRASFARLSSNITKAGGDIQTIGIYDGVVYASCHCGNYNYSGTYDYNNPIPTASDVNNIKYIGAWDEATGAYLPDFWPNALDTRSGIGGWELTPDSNGCLWFGGDFDQGSFQGTGYQWLGGFGKFCQRDAVAPTVPANLRSSSAVGGVKLSWDAATDNSGGSVRYELMRDDRVIISTTGLSYIDTTGAVPANYWVRAVDNGGNRSATSNKVSLLAPDTVAPTAAITSPADGSSVYGPVTVTATASDDQAVASVDLLVDGTVVGTASTAPYSFSWNATAVGSHTLQARAKDTSNNTGLSAPITVTVPADTTAPSAPGQPVSTGVTTTAATISWPAATDDRGVIGYQVWRDGAQVGATASLSYTDTGLTPGGTYSYTVRAYDAGGNVSADSPALSVTTPTEVPPLFSDSFTAADGTPWSASWTTSLATGAADVQSGAGRLAVDDVSGAFSRAQLTGLAARGDSELLTSFSWSSNTALSYFNVYLRGSGGWQNAYRPKNGYGLQLQSNTGTVVIQKNVNSVTSTVQSVAGGQALTTAKQWLRLRVSGSTIQFKIWTDGTAEPTTWKATATDTDVTAAGQLFLSVVRGGTNVGAKSVSLDDLAVRDGQ